MIEEELQFKVEDWGLQVTFTDGEQIDNSNIIPKLKQLIELAKSNGKNRLMINALTAKRDVSILNMFQAGQFLFQLKTVGFKIAFIAPHLKGNKESRFMENVGYNRGIIIKYFADSDEALTWIKG